MSDTERGPEEIVASAEEMLRMARLGLADFTGRDFQRVMPGLSNAIVYGRAVTNVIENLRSKVSDFDAWYKPRSAALSKNHDFKRLYQLRSEILKQGNHGVSNSFYVQHLNTNDLMPLMANPPKGAKGFFMGDSSGGSGWEVELPSGLVVKHYVKLPRAVSVSSTLTIRVGEVDLNPAPILDGYLKAMEQIIMDARAKFL